MVLSGEGVTGVVSFDAAWFVSTLAFAVAMAATPGPNNAMVTASGARFGFRRTVPHILGISVGFPAMIVAVAVGAGTLLRQNPWVSEALRWVGIAYLLWLAWKIATAPTTASDVAGAPAQRPLGALQAALFQWVNPKAWVIAVGAVLTYTDAHRPVFWQAVLLAAVFLVVTIPTTACWTMVGVGAARALRAEAAKVWFNRAMAALLVASLLPMFWE